MNFRTMSIKSDVDGHLFVRDPVTTSQCIYRSTDLLGILALYKYSTLIISLLYYYAIPKPE